MAAGCRRPAAKAHPVDVVDGEDARRARPAAPIHGPCRRVPRAPHTDDPVFSIDGRRDGVLSCYVGIAATTYQLGGRQDLAEPQIHWIRDHQQVRRATQDLRPTPVSHWSNHLAVRYGGLHERHHLPGRIREDRPGAAVLVDHPLGSRDRGTPGSDPGAVPRTPPVPRLQRLDPPPSPSPRRTRSSGWISPTRSIGAPTSWRSSTSSPPTPAMRGSNLRSINWRVASSTTAAGRSDEPSVPTDSRSWTAGAPPGGARTRPCEACAHSTKLLGSPRSGACASTRRSVTGGSGEGAVVARASWRGAQR